MSVHVYPLAGGITTLSFLLLEATVHDVNLSQNNLASDSLDSTHFVIGPNSVPHRARHLHRRFDHSGTLGEHGDVHRLSRHPGFRRRDPHPRGHGRGRRPLRSKRQREGPGALRCRVRYRKRDRTPHRRIHRGCGLMALVLLHQPPSSPSSVPADDQEVPDARRRRHQAHRLQGDRDAVRASAGLHPADPDGGARSSSGSAQRPRS